jgi:hypothetical protein
MMEEKEKLEEEKKAIEIILDLYNSEPQLKNRPGASEYIDSLLDRYNEIKKKLNNTPS